MAFRIAWKCNCIQLTFLIINQLLIKIYRNSFNFEFCTKNYSLWLKQQFVNFFSGNMPKRSKILSAPTFQEIFEMNQTILRLLLEMHKNWRYLKKLSSSDINYHHDGRLIEIRLLLRSIWKYCRKFSFFSTFPSISNWS